MKDELLFDRVRDLRRSRWTWRRRINWMAIGFVVGAVAAYLARF
jgi:hypothetical protein